MSEIFGSWSHASLCVLYHQLAISAHIMELPCHALHETLPHSKTLRIVVVVTGEVNMDGLGEVERQRRRQENCLKVTLSFLFS
jgi:hypothetical protein